jgi:hypothetical protein
LFERFGNKGIVALLKTAYKLEEYEIYWYLLVNK